MAQEPWRTLEPGLELGRFTPGRSAPTDDPRFIVLRIDPAHWSLEFAGLSLHDAPGGRTARQWSQALGLTAAINAGMYARDYRTHVGYLRYRGHVNNDNVNNYQSVAAFDPRREGLPLFRLVDLDDPAVRLSSILRDYASVVQNLRLIKRPGQNRWSQKDERWIEAALGEDGSGRILFIFCSHPYSMHDFNNALLDLGIDLVAAQHLEGGTQAQLYVNAGGMELELSGAPGNAFHQDHRLTAAWPIPNVLGIRPRAAQAD
jgi:hypothetical protein